MSKWFEWEAFDPNPSVTKYTRGKNKGNYRSKGDCVVRAFCKLWDKDWDSTARLLFERALIEHDMPNSPEVWKKFLVRDTAIEAKKPASTRSGYKWKTVADVAHETIGLQRTIICSCPNHIVAVRDGRIYDSWCSSHLTVREVFCHPEDKSLSQESKKGVSK